MYKILHFADLHLDTSFASIGLPSTEGDWRRRDLRATLGRILTLARERRVDAVTIAGDLYEHTYALPDTAEFLRQQFSRMEPIQVFISPGQHDPYRNDSFYALTRWPENVTIFSEGRLSNITIGPGINLWGAACPPARGQRGFGDVEIDTSNTNILLLHAASADQTDSRSDVVFLADAAAIEAAGFDFALLGYHHSSRLSPANAPRSVYPGSPEPLTDEEADGVHQIVVLTIDDGVCTPELIPISQWRYHSVTVDLTECNSMADVGPLVSQAIHAIEDTDHSRSIWTATLNGRLGFVLDWDALAESVSTDAYVRYKTNLSIGYDLDQLSREQTVRGMLVRKFQEQLSDAEGEAQRERLLTALNTALVALDGKQVQRYEVG